MTFQGVNCDLEPGPVILPTARADGELRAFLRGSSGV